MDHERRVYIHMWCVLLCWCALISHHIASNRISNDENTHETRAFSRRTPQGPHTHTVDHTDRVLYRFQVQLQVDLQLHGPAKCNGPAMANAAALCCGY